MRMRKIRELTISGGTITPDADPNLTPPAEADCYQMTGQVMDRMAGDVGGVEGHRLCVRFVNASVSPVVQIPGATADFQTWGLDEGASAEYAPGQAWCSLTSESAAKHAQLYAAPFRAKLFVQLTAVAAVGAATKAQVWLEESAQVEG